MVLVYSIEYSHIYSDQEFGAEHMESVRHLRSVESSLHESAAIRRSIMVDDYSPPKSTHRLVLGELLSQLADRHAEPDCVVAESALEPYCTRVIEKIGDSRLRRSLLRYQDSRQANPCSLFVAAWYLLRLGAFGRPEISTLFGEPSHLYGDRLVTIIPHFFESAERKALEIILKTDDRDLANLIQVRYFDSPRESTASPDRHDDADGDVDAPMLLRSPVSVSGRSAPIFFQV